MITQAEVEARLPGLLALPSAEAQAVIRDALAYALALDTGGLVQSPQQAERLVFIIASVVALERDLDKLNG